MVYLERLRRLNGLPLSLDLTYLAARRRASRCSPTTWPHQDIFVLIERHSGQPPARPTLTVEAVNADPHSAALLAAAPGAALLVVERLTRLADGRPVDLEYIRFRGDRLMPTAASQLTPGPAGR